MPIVDGSVKYEMPDNIKQMITLEFCTLFLKELHHVFGVSIKDSDLDCFVYEGGTAGWCVAFANACRKLQLDELYKYYLSLEWFDSDVFDGLLEDYLVEYKLILSDFLSDEVARQNNLSAEDVTFCDHCGKFFRKDEMIENELNLSDEEPYIELLCKTCANGEPSNELTWDVEKTVVEVFEKTDADFFICEKCGEAHWTAHKGNQYCLHCETEKVENANCNKYYRECLDVNKEYKKNILDNK